MEFAEGVFSFLQGLLVVILSIQCLQDIAACDKHIRVRIPVQPSGMTGAAFILQIVGVIKKAGSW